MHALVVDDDPAMLNIFRRCLTMWGWEVAACRSVASALETFHGGSFGLALCDVNLPDGDGVSLAKALLKSAPTLAIVIASGMPANLERARKAGLVACIQKPFALADLQGVIDLECARKRSSQSQLP